MAITFTSAAAAKIKQAVRKVLNTPDDRTRERTPPGPDEQSFFAWITGCDVSGKRYNWARVYPDMSSDSPDLILDSAMKWKLFGQPPVTGFETAYEANGRQGLTDRIVLLTYAGRNADNEAVYTFICEIQQPDNQLPIHDHRDNCNGGFAFAVYHPGTSLPQQPWHV